MLREVFYFEWTSCILCASLVFLVRVLYLGCKSCILGADLNIDFAFGFIRWVRGISGYLYCIWLSLTSLGPRVQAGMSIS